MIKYFTILTAFLIFSCASNKCLIADKNFVDAFNSKIQIIKRFEKGTIMVNDDEYRMTLIYLAKVTGILSKADYSSTMGYENKKDYQEDMHKWKKWL